MVDLLEKITSKYKIDTKLQLAFCKGHNARQLINASPGYIIYAQADIDNRKRKLRRKK